MSNLNTATEVTATTEVTAPVVAPLSGLLSFSPYVSGIEIKTTSETRAIKCLYQANKDTGKTVQPNSYIVVPSYLSEQVILDNIEELSPHLIGYLQSIEDEAVKAKHRKGTTQLGAGTFNLAHLMELLEAKGLGARLSGKEIADWFEADVSDPFATVLLEKVGATLDNATAEQLAKITGIMETYKVKFMALASPKSDYMPKDLEQLEKVLVATGELTSSLGARLQAKLVKLAKPKVEIALEDF